jgi:multidrug resistance protein MdtO
MRRVLASILRSGANLFLLIDDVKDRDQLSQEMESLRDRLGKSISTLRTMSEAVDFEFGNDRERHVRSSELIIQISITAAALIWNQVAFLHQDHDEGFRTEQGLAEMRRRLAGHMNSMAECIVLRTGIPLEQAVDLRSLALSNREQYREYALNTMARYEDLETLASALSREV